MATGQHESLPGKETASGIDVSEQSVQAKWPRYLDAALGFSNHWHPVLFGRELDEAAFRSIEVMGEQILLTRVDGKVRAIKDQCAHRGVPFSRDPLCFQKGTISCWYHGWTYRLDDGELCDVLTSPGSPVIGQVRIPVFPVQEAKGMVFVFVGDAEPHELARDLPPGFLDADAHCLGIRRTVQSNWRLGAENGFDPTHIILHRNSPLVEKSNLALPYGFVPGDREAIEIRDEGWPHGVIAHIDGNFEPIFEAKIGGETVLKKEVTDDMKPVAAQVSIWLPGVLKVDPFPEPPLVYYEFYVAVDEGRHEYFQVLQRKVESTADVAAFEQEFEQWLDLALHGLNDDDVWAREAQEDFYRNQNGWEKEHLFPPDMCIVQWRQLASVQAQGVRPGAGGGK